MNFHDKKNKHCMRNQVFDGDKGQACTCVEKPMTQDKNMQEAKEIQIKTCYNNMPDMEIRKIIAQALAKREKETWIKANETVKEVLRSKYPFACSCCQTEDQYEKNWKDKELVLEIVSDLAKALREKAGEV